ncbi:MAG: hybrid sensor histidine kinase/response regulator [Balneola sp.]
MHQVEVNPLDFLILVVDDAQANVVLLSHILEKEGFRVEKCYDGDEALEKIKQNTPDLILLDIMMPNMSGIEVGEELRRSEYEYIPIIFLSSSNDSVDKVQAFESGGVDFLNKPFDKDELLIRVRNHLMLKILREESEQQLKTLKEREHELSEANQKKYKLMRMLSHDIKNPISGIMGLVSILLEDDTLDAAEKTEMLELIKISSDKLLSLVKDLLDREVIENQFDSIELKNENIVAVVQQVIKANRSKAALKKIKILYESYESEIVLRIDKEKIQNIFNTLLANAIKFSASKSEVKVTIEESENAFVLIKVIDKGIGIPNAMLPNFVVSSQREEQDNPHGVLGVGLGLEEVRAYVEAHSGKIWVNSQDNEGTTFFIELPLRN